MPVVSSQASELTHRSDRPKAQDDARCSDGETKLLRMRRHQRTQVNVRVIVHSGLSAKQMLIRDMSNGGLCLVGAYGLFPGCEVKISLITGETRLGIVRWWLAGTCGVRFIQPLEHDEPFRKAVEKRRATTPSQHF